MSKIEPVALLGISIGGKDVGTMKIQLKINEAPETVRNFVYLCIGNNSADGGPPLCFKFAPFHRIVPGFMCQGGDFTVGNGFGGEAAIFGKFPHENYNLRHDKRGIVAMASQDREVTGSQFYMTFGRARHLDGDHIVFGEVVDASLLKILGKIEKVGSKKGRPAKKVIIETCGVMFRNREIFADTEFRWLQRDYMRGMSSSDDGDRNI